MTDVKHTNNTSNKQPSQQTFVAGDYFLVEGELVELCQVGTHRYTLIVCEYGNRYGDGQRVDNYSKITLEEVKEMAESGSVVPVKSVEISYTI